MRAPYSSAPQSNSIDWKSSRTMLDYEDDIKGWPDEKLQSYAQAPTGEYPQYLVISEIQRRTDMRSRFAAKEQQPDQTVSEQIVAAASPQQGIGSLQPQMPPGAPGGAMPPSGPMPPEMMAAQGDPMASQMPMMAGGGIIPPNSLAEDASKYNPDMLYELDPSQIGMISPTDMGIPSVLPMARGGVVRMDNGGVAEDGGYPQWARDWLVDPDDPYELAMMAGASMGGIGLAGLGVNVARKAGVRGLQKLFKEMGRRARQKGRTEGNIKRIRGDKGRILSDEAAGRQIVGRGSKAVKEHLSPFRKDFYFKTLPAVSGAGLVGTKAYQRLIEDHESGALGSGMRPLSEEEIATQLGLKGGGIIKMNEGGMTWGAVKDALISKGVENPAWLVGKPPNEFLNDDDIAQMKAYVEARKSVDPRVVNQGETQPEVNLTSRNQGFAKSLYTPESGLSPDLSDEPPITAAPPSIDLKTAMEQAEAEGGLGLTKYDLSKQIQELDTTTQEAKIQSQIDALEKMKGQTPDTFDITESVLRSGERADERAINQALINLGAGIASGDIVEGFRTAGTAVGAIRQRQEEFQQLADIRKAEAQAKASSDKMTRDISITSSQIAAYGDLQDQKNAASKLLMDREKMLIDATATGNANLIAEATNKRDVAEMAIEINQFNRTLQASIAESKSKTERARIRREQAAITSLGPDALREGINMTEGEKARWIPKNLPDKTPGWSSSRALQDMLAGLGYLSGDDGVSDFGFRESGDTTGFTHMGLVP